jgi:tetraacyldisaccharide 4'-kinase
MRSILSIFLFFLPMHLLYIKVKNFIYDNNVLKPTIIGGKVISVGNISLGGSGKTPFTIALSNFLCGKGFSVGVITRGYGRKNIHDSFLLDKQSWEDCGDETLVLKNNLDPSIPIYISKNKIFAAQTLSKMGCDIIILDDAFQHRKISRDIDIVLVTPDELVNKNQKTFPWGLLREPFYNIKRANIVINTKENLYSEKKSTKYPLSLHTEFQDELLCSIKNTNINIKGLSKINNLLSICGIGKPESFHSSLKSLNINPLEYLTYSDHHNFTKKDMDIIIEKIKKYDIKGIVCTEKDWVKLISFQLELVIPIYAIRLNYSLNKDIEETVLRLL